jgi:hypothetical protein
MSFSPTPSPFQSPPPGGAAQMGQFFEASQFRQAATSIMTQNGWSIGTQGQGIMEYSKHAAPPKMLGYFVAFVLSFLGAIFIWLWIYTDKPVVVTFTQQGSGLSVTDSRGIQTTVTTETQIKQIAESVKEAATVPGTLIAAFAGFAIYAFVCFGFNVFGNLIQSIT